MLTLLIDPGIGLVIAGSLCRGMVFLELGLQFLERCWLLGINETFPGPVV